MSPECRNNPLLQPTPSDVVKETALFVSNRLLLVLVLIWISCGTENLPTSLVSESDTDSTQLVTVQNEALDMALANAVDIPRLQVVTVAKGGRTLRRRFYNGSYPDSAYDIHSATKSVMSALTGIAIEQGIFTGVNQPLSELLVSVVDSIDDAWGNVTLKHLLSMSAGHDVDGGGLAGLMYGQYPIRDILALPVTHEPGSRFVYSNAATHVLSVALAEAAGMSTSEYARVHLFEPMGWDAKTWRIDAAGYFVGGGGLHLTASNMIDFGTLYLNQGRIDDKQIIPADWVHRSTQEQFAVSYSNSPKLRDVSGYGFLWWLGEAAGLQTFSARGFGGQYIFVIPDLELVVATICDPRLKTANGVEVDAARITSLVVDEIIPAMN